MPAIGLLEGLAEYNNTVVSCYDLDSNSLILPKHHTHYSPGYFALLAAFAKEKVIPEGNIIFSSDSIQEYAEAIGFSKAVWGHDVYPRQRVNDGKNYSPLVHLNEEGATDRASETINNCIRHFFKQGVHDAFVNELCDVVGDLHSNVWAHGKKSGFSMAQKIRDIYSKGEYCLEFALADHGMGFLRELKRAGVEIGDDADAIKWCIKEGHSTKKEKSEDDWAQSMPDDVIGNPLRGIERTKRMDGNHHMGLGLYKLMQLVKRFSGQLNIASGDKIFLLAEDGKEAYKDSVDPWQGVAISCRFNTGLINRGEQPPVDSGVKDVFDLLRKS